MWLLFEGSHESGRSQKEGKFPCLKGLLKDFQYENFFNHYKSFHSNNTSFFKQAEYFQAHKQNEKNTTFTILYLINIQGQEVLWC